MFYPDLSVELHILFDRESKILMSEIYGSHAVRSPLAGVVAGGKRRLALLCIVVDVHGEALATPAASRIFGVRGEVAVKAPG
jgi:hypothetical protein